MKFLPVLLLLSGCFFSNGVYEAKQCSELWTISQEEQPEMGVVTPDFVERCCEIASDNDINVENRCIRILMVGDVEKVGGMPRIKTPHPTSVHSACRE